MVASSASAGHQPQGHQEDAKAKSKSKKVKSGSSGIQKPKR